MVAILKAKSGLDFGRVYLPLVMGGVVINDQFAVAKENPADLLRDLGMVLEQRLDELGEADRPIYAMITDIIARTGQRYGFYLGK